MPNIVVHSVDVDELGVHGWARTAWACNGMLNVACMGVVGLGLHCLGLHGAGAQCVGAWRKNVNGPLSL
jgi:hypothetical protein